MGEPVSKTLSRQALDHPLWSSGQDFSLSAETWAQSLPETLHRCLGFIDCSITHDTSSPPSYLTGLLQSLTIDTGLKKLMYEYVQYMYLCVSVHATPFIEYVQLPEPRWRPDHSSQHLLCVLFVIVYCTGEWRGVPPLPQLGGDLLTSSPPGLQPTDCSYWTACSRSIYIHINIPR